MQRFLLIYLILITVCAHSLRLSAQPSLSYNLNSDNGLPSDKIYGITIDRHGYLWICTDHGLVKYNGYTCKVFSTTDGLANDDIWGLIEDRKGRMWVQTISDEIGYIANDKYHKTHLRNMDGMIYPRNTKRCDSGIMFYTSIDLAPEGHMLCYERNDTIFPLTIKDGYFPDIGTDTEYAMYVSNYEKVYFFKNGKNYLFGNYRDVLNHGARPVMTEMPPILQNNVDKYFKKRQTFVIGDHIMAQHTNTASNIIYAQNITTGIWDSIDVAQYGINEPTDHIVFDAVTAKDDSFFVVTTNHVLAFSAKERIRHLYTVSVNKQIENTDNKKRITGYTNGTIWDTCIATMANGLYMVTGNEKYNILPGLRLRGYTHIGTINDQTSYWWNTDEKTMIAVEGKHVTKEYHMEHIHDLYKAIALNRDSVLLIGSFNYYLNTRNDKINETEIEKYGRNARHVIIDNPNHYFNILKGGIEETRPGQDGSPTDKKIIDVDRYEDATYDSRRKILWAYHSTKITVVSDSARYVIKNANISVVPTEKIEKICIDTSYGNVFIKRTGTVNIYGNGKNNCSEILKNINLKNATIDIYKNMLIVIGDFGVLFTKIRGRGILSPPVIYRNAKKMYYKKRYSYALIQGSLLLNTERGAYEIKIPADSEFDAAASTGNINGHKILANYNAIINTLKQDDTIELDQSNLTIFLDVINPIGNGNITYRYQTDTKNNWQTSNSSEIILPNSFIPDNYYPINVQWTDDAYKSDVIKLMVYIKPAWWQTKSAKRIMWASGALLGALIIIISILITRRMVLKAAQKKQLQMEMELKSIYAQINPHFIFNSLTSALLLISRNRMDEAYTHVSRFSKLLRNYLKSSRNKYISLADEIENLHNYIELQQTRFKDRFVCDITADPELDSDQINIPALLIQPFVENAINHGILHSNLPGQINIEFKSIGKGKSIQCVISDNGIGRQKSRAQKNSSENTYASYGNLLIKDLIDIFNKYEKMKIDIIYEDRDEPETGTSVIITITNIQI